MLLVRTGRFTDVIGSGSDTVTGGLGSILRGGVGGASSLGVRGSATTGGSKETSPATDDSSPASKLFSYHSLLAIFAVLLLNIRFFLLFPL